VIKRVSVQSLERQLGSAYSTCHRLATAAATAVTEQSQGLPCSPTPDRFCTLVGSYVHLNPMRMRTGALGKSKCEYSTCQHPQWQSVMLCDVSQVCRADCIGRRCVRATACTVNGVMHGNYACRSLARLDVCGHFMSLVALLSLTSLMVRRGASNGFLVPISMLMLAVLNFMQLCLIRTRPAVYRAWRHRLAVGNRIGRLLVGAMPALRLRSDSIPRFLGSANQHTMGMVLLATLCSFPLMLFYNTLCFVVSAAATLLLQPVAMLVCGIFGVHSHPMLEATPGMQQFADNVCSTVRAVFELALHVAVDQGTMPGVTAAGFDAFGTPSRCAGRRTFVQLLLFSNLSLTYFLPVFVTYVVELRHKSQFWHRRGVCIVVQASPLLPFPDNHLVSHACVFCLAPLLLWFLAEFLTPLLA